MTKRSVHQFCNAVGVGAPGLSPKECTVPSRCHSSDAIGIGAALAYIPVPTRSLDHPSPFRAVPHPHRKHLDAETAAKLTRWAGPFDLGLESGLEAQQCDEDKEVFKLPDFGQYTTISLAALTAISEREWFHVEFGLSELTPDAALAISGIRSHFVVFTHIEYAHPEAVAILLSGNARSLEFANLVEISAEGLEEVNAHFRGEISDCYATLDGKYVIDERACRALLSSPWPSLSLRTLPNVENIPDNVILMLRHSPKVVNIALSHEAMQGFICFR